ASSTGSPLFMAMREDREHMSRILLARGANPNTTGMGGRTPLHIAARNNDTDMMELLIASGADVNAKDKDGWTPLHNTPLYYVAAPDNADTFGLPVVPDADIIPSMAPPYETPLHYAPDRDSRGATKLLLANGADIEAKDNDGATPLHIAASAGNDYIVELLLSRGADIHAKDNNGDTPLAYALSWRRGMHPMVAKVLIDHGAEIDVTDDNKAMLLSFAAGAGFYDLVERLIASGADVNPENKWGYADHAPLLDAILNGHDDV
ncbi:unnamed protein product, partial [marine sediment metagenome]